LYICPDVDILIYALAERLDERKGWGIKNDSWNFREAYSTLNPNQAWFRLGDSDLALSILRTELIVRDWKLSRITDHFRKIFKIKQIVIPATDNYVQTFVTTTKGRMHLQEFWVKNNGKLNVLKVDYEGISKAKPNPKTLGALSDRVLILPANPVSSILPTVNLSGIRRKLATSKVIAISPFVGSNAFSGPAAKFMTAIGARSNSYEVARLYSEFLKIFLVDSKEDPSIINKVRDLGIECLKTNILIKTEKDRKHIVSEIVNLL
jgi:LPPG:FO 2-phospho-L-lactate transferase